MLHLFCDVTGLSLEYHAWLCIGHSCTNSVTMILWLCFSRHLTIGLLRLSDDEGADKKKKKSKKRRDKSSSDEDDAVDAA